MIRIPVGERVLGLGFSYPILITHVKDRNGKQRQIPVRGTSCKLFAVEEHDGHLKVTTLAQGVASCHHKDNFCRETGRKVAIAKALKNAAFTYDQRKLIWEAWLNRPRPKNPKSGAGNQPEIPVLTTQEAVQ